MSSRILFIVGYPIWIFVIAIVWFLSNVRFLGLEPATFAACYDVFKEITGVK